MIWIVLGVLAGLAVWPIAEEMRRRPLDRAAREDAPGQIARLSQGRTHYRWHGPSRGPVVVAVHGLTTPSVVWDELAAQWGQLGYRVLSYDLYGRGRSDRVEGRQTARFFRRQLLDLLQDQGVKEDVTFLGYSMGGAIVADFVATHPEMARRVVLIASAGAEMNESRAQSFARSIPVLGDWLHHLVEARQLRDAANDVADTRVRAALLEELGRRGYLPAILSSRRGILSVRQRDVHSALREADVPVIALWGGQDQVIPLTALGTLTQWNRDIRQEVIETANHALPLTHVDEIGDRLRDVLREPL